MFTSFFRVAALMTILVTTGAEYSRRSTDDGRTDAPRSFPPPFSIEGPAIFDISAVATSTPDSLTGVEVVAEDVCVSELTDRGFWVRPDPDAARVFVRAAEGRLITVRVGELVTLHGEVRLATRAMGEGRTARRTDARAVLRAIPYVYAYTVRPAWPRGDYAGGPTRSDTCATSRSHDHQE